MTKSFLKVIAAILAIIMLWAGALATDYLLVFEKEKKPVFCISRKIRNDVEIYNGIGYSYTITTADGKFKRIDFENFLGTNEYWVNCA